VSQQHGGRAALVAALVRGSTRPLSCVPVCLMQSDGGHPRLAKTTPELNLLQLRRAPRAHVAAGSMAVTAGGNYLCVWDLLGGGRLLKRLENFQKTVTCVRLSPLAGPDSAAAPRMLAGSLDGHVKVRQEGLRITVVSFGALGRLHLWALGGGGRVAVN
jgi:hypothetical protein